MWDSTAASQKANCDCAGRSSEHRTLLRDTQVYCARVWFKWMNRRCKAGQLTAVHKALRCAWSYDVCFVHQHTNEDSALCCSRTTERRATNEVGSAVMLLTYIWEVIASKFDRFTTYPGVVSWVFFYVIPRWKSRKKYLKFDRESFLPYPCQFTIHCNSIILRYLAWIVNSVVMCTVLRFLFNKNLQPNKRKKERIEGNGNKEQSNKVRDLDVVLSHLSFRLTISVICLAFLYIFSHPF
jgi:hypothetical protein